MDLPALTSPQHLWALLLLPVIYWLARPVRPRRTLATPHLRQWQRAMQRVGRRPLRFRWLRFWLMVAAFVCAVVAFAGPTIGGRDGPRELVVVLDCSASMAAGGAFDDARALLAERLADIPDEVDVRVAQCAESVVVRRGTRAALLEGLPTPAGAGAADLDALARSVAGPNIAVWTITDGGGAVPASGALSIVGERADNAALTAIAVDDAWPLPRVEIRLAVANLAPTARTVTLGFDGVAHADVDVALRAGEQAEKTIAVERGAGGAVRLFLRDVGDAFAGDDVVVLHLPPPPPGAIAVLGDAEAGPELHAAAAALAAECGGEVVGPDAPSVGFLLAEGGRMPAGGSDRAVTFGTRFGDRPLDQTGLVGAPVVIDWDRDDPVTAGLDLSELVVEEALRSEHLPTGERLVWSDAGPLVVRSTSERGASIHTAFRLSDSNFALLAAFPQFLRRAYLASWRGDAEPVVDPGNVLDVRESDLRPRAGPGQDRPLPEFGAEGRSLAALLLLLALAAAAARLYS